MIAKTLDIGVITQFKAVKGHDCKHFTVIHFRLNSPKNADLYTPITKIIHDDNPMESHASFGLKSNIHYKPNHILIWRFPDMEVPQIQAIRPWLSTEITMVTWASSLT
jgi:hypothetical protein